MKKWNKPELLTLGVDMTMHEEKAPKVHGGYCHAINGACTGTVNNHSADGHKDHTWSGNQCLEHQMHEEGNGNGQPACCCYTAPNSPEMLIS